MHLAFLIIFIITTACSAIAQVDTNSTKNIVKEAPDDLKLFLNQLNNTENKTTIDAIIEIDGLLIDNTKTKNGSDFYEYFYSNWIAPENAKNYSVFIIEKPYRTTTTMIEVKINESTVFQSFLQPRSDIIEEISKQAITRTQIFLQNYEEILKQLNGDDLTGSGIY